MYYIDYVEHCFLIKLIWEKENFKFKKALFTKNTPYFTHAPNDLRKYS